ncbi:uncharacterized protein LOC144101003 [Amblyomma americanum]
MPHEPCVWCMHWVKAENGHCVRHERQAGGERDWSTCFLGPTGMKMKQALKRCPLPSQGFPCRCTQEWCHKWTAPSCPDAASILRLVDALARAIWTRCAASRAVEFPGLNHPGRASRRRRLTCWP